ncbi:glycosyltransferase family 9 protein [Shewanella sp. 0m-8]
MTLASPKFLFVPVSSAEGMGEYMRSLIVANEVKRRWPNATIQFILSRHAPYASTCPYPAALLDDTPTKNIKAVNDFMSFFQPDFVIFDASGRRSQLTHANKLGAKVIFLSQHKRKRSRGMKVLRARVTDSHWVVQPEFVIGPISWLDRLKLKLIDKPEPTVIGPIFVNPNSERQAALLKEYNLSAGGFILLNAGSGGHTNKQGYIVEEFARAAADIYQATRIPCVMVYGPNYPNTMFDAEGVTAIDELNHGDFIDLLDAAKVAVLSGGDTLLQAIALKKPTLSVAVSKDQNYRLKVCKERGLTVCSDSNAVLMLAGLTELIRVENLAKLESALALCKCINGLDIGMDIITDLYSHKFGVQS